MLEIYNEKSSFIKDVLNIKNISWEKSNMYNFPMNKYKFLIKEIKYDSSKWKNKQLMDWNTEYHKNINFTNWSIVFM